MQHLSPLPLSFLTRTIANQERYRNKHGMHVEQIMFAYTLNKRMNL